MMNSGYVLVDATGLDISETSEVQTVDGLYAKLETAYATNKMVILTGVVNGDAAVSPVPVSMTEGAGMSFTLSGFSAVVSDDDTVTPAV